MSEKLYLLTPAGRLVQGDCFKGSDKDANGRPRVSQSGQPKMQWYMGLAIANTDPAFATFWAQVQAKAQEDFPNGSAQLPTFAWKLIDGDATEHASKPGFPGHYVLRLTTGFQPQVIDRARQQITDPETVKRGCYLQVAVSVQGNSEPQTGKPGVYINPMTVMLIGYGEAISSAPPLDQVFATIAPLPAGASATPLAPAPAGIAPTAAPGAIPAVAGGPPVVAADAVPPVAAPLPAPIPVPAASPIYAAPAEAIPPAVAPVIDPVAAPPPMPGTVTPVTAAPVVAAPVAATVTPAPGFLTPGLPAS